MKKKIKFKSPNNKYNRLFKLLSFDQNLLSAFFITIAIFLYAFAILGLFFLLDVPIEIPIEKTI